MTCDLLRTVLLAHGGTQNWTEFSRVTASVSIGGQIWKYLETPSPFAEVLAEILTQEQRVTMVPRSGEGIRSVFRPNSISIQSSNGEVVETRYNPGLIFQPTADLNQWDDFQLAYVSSYSIWNGLMQPFLFDYSGFEVEEANPIYAGEERWRGLKVNYPSYIASPSRQLFVYVDDSGFMRRQDFAHGGLDGMRITSLLSDYEEIQGLVIPTRRSIYSSIALESEPRASLFASLKLTDIRFRKSLT